MQALVGSFYKPEQTKHLFIELFTWYIGLYIFGPQSRLAAVSEKVLASGNPPLTYSYQWFWWLNGLEDLSTSVPVLTQSYSDWDSLTDSTLKFSIIRNYFHDTSLSTYYHSWGSRTALYRHLFSNLWKLICSYWQKMLEICLNKLQDGCKVAFWQHGTFTNTAAFFLLKQWFELSALAFKVWVNFIKYLFTV